MRFVNWIFSRTVNFGQDRIFNEQILQELFSLNIFKLYQILLHLLILEMAIGQSVCMTITIMVTKLHMLHLPSPIFVFVSNLGLIKLFVASIIKMQTTGLVAS